MIFRTFCNLLATHEPQSHVFAKYNSGVIYPGVQQVICCEIMKTRIFIQALNEPNFSQLFAC